MFVVESGGKLTVKNITLDGGSEQGLPPRRTIVKVNQGGTLILTNGAKLQNNKLRYNEKFASTLGGYELGKVETNLSDDIYNGGGVFVDYGSLIMNGNAIIQNCSAHNGGGVLVQSGSFQMSGEAKIQNNEVKFESSYSYYPFDVGAGGGVLITGNGTMDFTGGTISDNKAGYGGGVAVGTEFYTATAGNHGKLTMNGSSAKIDNNEAGANGGGIFIGKRMEAEVKEGTISNNRCATDPRSYECEGRRAFYGGGGIYVQGDETDPGVLRISCVEITNNNALTDLPPSKLSGFQ